MDIGIAVGISINLMRAERFSSGSEVFSSSLMLIFAITLIYFPISMCWVTCQVNKKTKNIKERKHLQKLYGPLFPSIRMRSPTAVKFNLIFIIRRYAMIVVLVIIPDERTFV